MPDYSKAYQEALQQARQEFLSPVGVPKLAYEQLLQVYARAILDIDSDLGTGAITEARGKALKDQINKRIIELGERLGILFRSQKIAAINAAVRGHSNGLSELNKLSGLSLRTNFTGIQNETLALMMARRGLFGAKDYQSVIKRKLNDMAKDVDAIINSAIVRGVSAERASQELTAVLISKDSSGDLQKLVSNNRLTKSKLNQALKEGDISPSSYKRARRAFYDSKRIMVTEINTAYREADIQSQYRSPVVKGTKWNLSGRHVVADICDIYADSDLFGLGEGVYPTGNYPGTPHPFCGCFPTAVLADIEDWGNPKEIFQPPTVKTDAYSKLFSEQTDHYAYTQVANANKYLDLAYQVSKRVRAA